MSTGIGETDKYMFESRAVKDQLDRLQRLFDVERETTSNVLKELEDKLNVAVVGKEEEAARLRVSVETNRDLRAVIDKVRSTAESQRQLESDRERIREKELASIRTALRDTQKDYEEKMRLALKKIKELEESELEARESALLVEKRREEEGLAYRRKVGELEQHIREIEQMIISEEKRLKGLIDAERERFIAMQSTLEARMNEEKESNNRAVSRTR